MEFWRNGFRVLRSLKLRESFSAALHSPRWHLFSIDGFCECPRQDRHEAEVELVAMGWLRCRSRRVVLLRVLRSISNHAGFSMGESFALWNWGCVVDARSVPGVRPAASLPRKDFRLDLRSDCCACCRLFQLRNLLCSAAGAGLSWRPARWAKSA